MKFIEVAQFDRKLFCKKFKPVGINLPSPLFPPEKYPFPTKISIRKLVSEPFHLITMSTGRITL